MESRNLTSQLKDNDSKRCLKKLFFTTALCGAVFIFSSPLVGAADVTTLFSGVLDGSTTYTRPIQVSGAAASWTAGGSTYNYFAEEFTPSGTGVFDISVLGTSTINDPVLYLYTGSFDPSTPLVNGVTADDDGGVGLLSKITGESLIGDTTYFIVVTSFNAGDIGAFDFEIVGPFGVAVGSSGYVDTASPTGMTALASYFSSNDDSGDRQTVANYLDTLDEAELVTALKTIFPVNTSSNAQSFVSTDAKTTGVLLNKIGNVLGNTSTTLQNLSVHGNNKNYGDWIFSHQKTEAELAQDPTLSLGSGVYKKFKSGSQGLWGEVVVTDTNGDGTANSLGYDGMSQGVVLGFEQAVSDTVLVGLLGGYFQSDVDLDSNAGQTEANTYNVGLYGQKLLDGVKLSGVVLFGYGDYNSERLIDLGATTATPSAKYSSKSVSGTLNVSKLYQHEGVKIEPFLSGSLSGAWVEGYQETGGGAFNMQVDDDRFSYGGIRLGVNFQKSFEQGDGSAINFKLMPYLGRNWEITGSQTSVSIVGGTGSSTVNGQSLTTYEAGLSGEISYDVTPSTSFKAGFDVSQTQYEQKYLGFLGAGVKF
ncbi:MAG: autotransporter outer membrane beta-barrel domain-containing protein [Sneathiella sp.]